MAARPRRVFLSHTSELRTWPERRTFVAAAESAVHRARDAVTDMAYFTARPTRPAAVCEKEVRSADVLVLIVGFRYGSLVADRSNVSYTELEYRTAVEAGIPQLVFLIGDRGDLPPCAVRDLDHGRRQEEFRASVRRSGVTTATVDTPEQLETALLQALHDLGPADAPVDPRPGGLDGALQLRYLTALARGCQVLDPRAAPGPAGSGAPSPPLTRVFVAPQVRRDGAGEPPRPVLDVVATPGVRRLALLGAPGAGKTALLRYLACTLPDSPPDGTPAAAQGWLPVLIDLRDYGDDAWRRDGWAAGTFVDYLDHLHARGGPGLPRDDLDALLHRGGRVVAMFDGLDEVRDPAERAGIVGRIAAFVDDHRRVRTVVTARTTGAARDLLDAAGFPTATLHPFDRDRIATFVHAWFDGTDRDGPGGAARHRARVLSEIDRSAATRELAGNPMLLTTLCALAGHGELPRERHRLYQHVIDALARGADRAPDDPPSGIGPLDEEDERELLRRVARRVRDDGTGQETAAGAELMAEFAAHLGERYPHRAADVAGVAEELVAAFAGRRGVVAELGPDRLGFIHPVLLDHCRADDVVHRFTVARELSVDDLVVDVVGAGALDPGRQEMLLLVAGQLHETFLARVVDHLLDLAGADGTHSAEAARLLVLGLRCLAEARRPSLLLPQGQRLLDELIAQLGRVRAGAGAPGDDTAAALGELGRAAEALRGIGSRFPGRETYLRWCRELALPPDATAGLVDWTIFGVAVVLFSDGFDLQDPLLPLVTRIVGSLGSPPAERSAADYFDQLYLDQMRGAVGLMARYALVTEPFTAGLPSPMELAFRKLSQDYGASSPSRPPRRHLRKDDR